MKKIYSVFFPILLIIIVFYGLFLLLESSYDSLHEYQFVVSIKSDLIIFKTLASKKRFFKSIEEKILKGYKKGHKGTAILWDYLINSRTEKILIHLDSDTIFLNDIVTDLIHAIDNEGNSIESRWISKPNGKPILAKEV